MHMLPPELQQRINMATASLTEAERELATAMQALQEGHRGDKVMISTSLETAFERLVAAKAALAALASENG